MHVSDPAAGDGNTRETVVNVLITGARREPHSTIIQAMALPTWFTSRGVERSFSRPNYAFWRDGRSIPSALAGELQLQAPPPIQIQYLDWKQAELVALCSSSNYGANSDMESVTSEYEYFWNDESNREEDRISVQEVLDRGIVGGIPC